MKKTYIILTILILLTLFIYIIYPNKDITLKEEPIPEEYTITYSYGGGYGTYVQTLSKEIIISSDGTITIQLTDKDLVDPITYKEDKKEIDKLYTYLIDNQFKAIKKELTNKNVTDYYSSYITIKYKGYERKIGGYAASLNKRYNKLETKIRDFIDEDKLEEFDNELKEYEKNISEN